MRYKIVISTPNLEAAKQIYEFINRSSVYRKNPKPIILHQIKEICDECVEKQK